MHVQLKSGKLLNSTIIEDVQIGFHDKNIVVIFLTNGTKIIEKYDTPEAAESAAQELKVKLISAGSGGGSGTGGVTDHNLLTGKNSPNQHSIAAITGLQKELDSKAEIHEYKKDTKYEKDNLVYVEGKICRVVRDYTSTTLGSDIKEAFEKDIEDGELLPICNCESGGGLIQKDSYADLPETGNPGCIYITKDTGQTYYWDSNTKTYVKTGTTRRTGIYSSSVNLPEKLGQSITINKSDLTEILAGAVPYSEGSEVIGPNQTHGVIVSSTSTTVTVKTTADLVVNSFQQVPTESALPTTGQGNVIYYIQDIDEFRIWDISENKYVPPAGLGGTMYLEKDITSNVTCGAAPAGTLFKEGMSLTEVAEKLLRKDITPTVSLTTTNGNKLFEMGTVLNGDNLKLTITNLPQVTVPMNEINFYAESNKINTTQIPFVTGTNIYTIAYTNNITTNTTLKGELVYNTNKVVSASQAINFAYASYWGTIKQGTLASAELDSIIASIGLTGTTTTNALGTFTKRLSNSKGFTLNNLTLNDERYCYIIPTNIGGKLTSIKDGNNFEYLSNGGTLELTLTGVTAANGDSISYYAYILKDPTTGSGFKFIFS